MLTNTYKKIKAHNYHIKKLYVFLAYTGVPLQA